MENQQTALAQPALFVLEYALAQLLMQWGIRPQAMLGYSLGEYVAACLAGVFSLEDALTLVARRAQLIAQLPAGAMLAVGLSEQAIQPYLTEQICLAAISGPASCVLAGPVEAIEQLEKHLSEQELSSRRLETTHAFHSWMLEPLSASLQELVGTVELQAPQIPYISNVTGTWITAEQATDPAYWAEHMRQTVRFAQGVEHLLEKNEPVLVEVGPGQSLSALVKQHPACGQQRFSLVVPTLPSVYERQSEQACLLTALGKLWLAGVTPDWQGFYAQQRRQRVPLPTYPFERQRYWIDPPRLQTVEKSAPRVHKGKKPDMADWFYLPAWEQGPLSIDSSDDMRKLRSPYLVFLDSFGLGEQVVERLTQEGHTCISVQPGEQFTQRDEQHFTIGPQEPADYLALVDALRSAGLLPKAVLHLWSLSAPTETAAGADGFQAMQERGFYSLLFLAQALGAEARDEPIQVIVASNRVQQVTGQEDVWPEKATMLGACKVISQEYQDIQCRSVDLVMDEPAVSSQHAVLDHLLAECTVASTDPVVAYREARRWIQTYQPVRLEAPSAHTTALRQQGVYLITGGLGGVGLVLAEHLAQTVQARLVLLGRSGLPARQSWSQWLESHEATESTSRKIERIQALEALGAEVLVLQADVADQVQMERAINQAYERFGALHGVIHAAGISNEAAFRAIQDIGRRECEWHFQPKVYGTYALEQALEGRELDFCVVFSSLSSVLGGLGFVGYTAANIFLDAFVTRHNQAAAIPWISVNWDSWLVKEDPHGVLGGTIAVFTMTPAEGFEAFTRILASGNTHLTTSTGDLQARIQQWVRLEALQESNETEQSAASSGAGNPKFAAGVASSRGEYEQQISEIWQQVLGLPQVGLCDNFFDLGGNSLSALQVLAKLKKALHLQLPVVALFEAPTISALVSYLLPACLPAPQTQQHLLAQRRQQAQQASGQQDIAIIGMSGRFPGASCLSQFWHNLRSGVESITFFSDDELLAAGVD